MPSPKGVPRPTASIAFLLASEPLPVSSRGPLTNLVVVAPDGTGVVKMLAVVHPCGPGRWQTPISIQDLESFL